MRRALPIPFLAALALAGCGGGSSVSSTQLRNEAARVCTSANAQMTLIPTPQSPAAAEAFLKRGISVLRPELTNLQTLKAPDDIAKVWNISLDAFSSKLSALSATAHRIETGADPVSEMQSLQAQLAPLESTEDGAWQALGVQACVNR